MAVIGSESGSPPACWIWDKHWGKGEPWAGLVWGLCCFTATPGMYLEAPEGCPEGDFGFADPPPCCFVPGKGWA